MLADTQPPDPLTVTPGVGGFLVFGLLALIVILLVLNMSKHLRRIDARAAQQEADEAERRAAEQGEGAADARTAEGIPETSDPPEGSSPAAPDTDTRPEDR